MTSSNVREEWNRFYTQLREASRYEKESARIREYLLNAYDALTPEEAVEVHAVLASWMVSEDEGLRYDATFLISTRLICTLRPSVVAAIEMVSKRRVPGYPLEERFLRRVLQEIDSAGSA